MARVKTLVVTGYGTNCENESAYAAKQAGSQETVIAHFSDLTAERVRLGDFNFLFFPGGFLDGDDLGAAQAAALRWRYAKTADGDPLVHQLQTFFEAGGLILGVCNGFQLLVKLGLLPAVGGKYFERQVSLGNNDSARFEARWVQLKANPKSPCVFTKGVDKIDLPVRHGEGKLVPANQEIFDAILANELVALQYVLPGSHEPTMDYPANPNGSPLGVAGLTDPSGRILGLMPHPEAFNHPTNHPLWTREEAAARSATLGTTLLANGVRFLAQN
jgi:phosphoribosylformylglycinamidine synthase